MAKNLPANAGVAGDMSLIPGSGRSPGGRNDNPSPVLLLGKFPRQRSLAGYSPWDHKESNRTEQLRVRHFTQLLKA